MRKNEEREGSKEDEKKRAETGACVLEHFLDRGYDFLTFSMLGGALRMNLVSQSDRERE